MNYQNYSNEKNPVVLITMEDGLEMEIELFTDLAPITVNNFLDLVSQNFYDGLIFHRVIEGFMIQGGDPLFNGTGGSKINIKGEFSANGFENNLTHTRGVISMARAMNFDSASSQFFIMHADAPHLDGNYAAFGALRHGYETLDKIATSKTNHVDKPVEDQKIKSIVRIK